MSSWFLSTVDPLIATIAVALTGASVSAVFCCWRFSPVSRLSRLSAWCLMGFGGWAWIAAFGWERGIALLLLSTGFAALVVIVTTAPWRQMAMGDRTLPIRNNTNAQLRWALLPFAKRFLVSGLLAFFAAIGAALLLFRLLQGPAIDRTLFSALALMVIWPMLVLWSWSRPSLWRTGGWLMVVGAAGMAFTPAANIIPLIGA